MHTLDITNRICKAKVKNGRRCTRRLRPSVLYCWQHKVQSGRLANETKTGAEPRRPNPQLHRVASTRFSPASSGPSKHPRLTLPSNFQDHGDSDDSGTITVNQDCGNTTNQNCGNTMNQNCGNTTTTNNSTSQIINLKESTVPKTAAQYHTYINTFITNSFPMFFGPYDPFVQTLVGKAVGEVKRASNEFGLPRELAPGIVKLALYDFVILCDNSLSMRKHKKALKNTLLSLARLSTLLAPVGISIRFLNHLWDCNGDFDNLLTAEEVERRFSKVWFCGLSTLGTTLSKKIVQPMIIRKAEERTLKRPVITMIITDGEPFGERRETLRETIQSCKQSMALQSYGKAAAVFVVSRIGNSTEADKFIGELQCDKAIMDMTYCSTNALDEQQEVVRFAR